MLQVIITGNTGQDPELRYTADGKAILSISVGVNTRRRSADGEWADHTDWFRVKTMRGTEKLVERIGKGTRLLVTGKLEVGAYMSKKNNEPVASLDVWADTIEVLSRSANQQNGDDTEGSGDDKPAPTAAAANNSSSAKAKSQPARASDNIELDDLPF